MIHVLSFTAATFFVVGIVRAFWTAKNVGPVPAVVHSATLWAGLLTLAVIPVARAEPARLARPLLLCPVIAFAVATLLLQSASYVLRNLEWHFPPVITAGIFARSMAGGADRGELPGMEPAASPRSPHPPAGPTTRPGARKRLAKACTPNWSACQAASPSFESRQSKRILPTSTSARVPSS